MCPQIKPCVALQHMLAVDKIEFTVMKHYAVAIVKRS